MLKRITLAIALSLGAIFLAVTARADLVGEPFPYTIDGQPYQGYYAQNQGFGDNQPLVLLVHDWNGLGDYERRRTQMLAEQGYTAFAVDLYGADIRPTTTEESRAQSSKLYDDRDTLRSRLFASLDAARTLPNVDGDRVVAIGYCFGGASVLEFARAGADIDGFVSFHGGLETPEGQDYSQTQAPILVLHGANDPVAPMSQVAALADELTAANVDFDMEIYGGARHSFTVWSAKGDSSQYDPHADTQSWNALLNFLETQVR